MEYIYYFMISYISFGLGMAVMVIDVERKYMTNVELIVLFVFVVFAGVFIAINELHEYLTKKR